MPFVQVLWLFALCFIAALVALLLVLWLQSRRGAVAAARPDAGLGAVFVFDGETLLDASASARALLATSRLHGPPWPRFLAWATPRFPGIEQQLATLGETGRISLTSESGDGVTLIAEWCSGMRRITLIDAHLDPRSLMIDSLSQKAQDAELGWLRDMMEAAPLPVWREDADGQVVWGNQAYAALVLACEDAAGLWPLPQVIAVQEAGRVRVDLPGGGVRWFDCRPVPGEGGRTVFALPLDAAVQAETALGSFVQTLTKTFACLPIGLAIFDRQRRLQLFNPALTDLTGLPVEFLSSRPALFRVLDLMRETGRLPEPRDYKAWRHHLVEMEKSAADGFYEETWTLPSGQTWRVSGRPHPEGALALLVEDISDQISHTRRMRADLELGQSVIDASDEAVLVLSAAGQLVMANSAYARLWGHDPSEGLVECHLPDLVAHWQAACAPDDFWSRIGDFVGSAGARQGIEGSGRLNDGRQLFCRLVPLAGGASLIGFSIAGNGLRAGQAGMRLVAPGEAGAGPATRGGTGG